MGKPLGNARSVEHSFVPVRAPANHIITVFDFAGVNGHRGLVTMMLTDPLGVCIIANGYISIGSNRMDREIGFILIASDDPALYPILLRFILGEAWGRQRKDERHHKQHSCKLTQHTTSSFFLFVGCSAWRASIVCTIENDNKNFRPKKLQPTT